MGKKILIILILEKISVFLVKGLKILGRVGIHIFFWKKKHNYAFHLSKCIKSYFFQKLVSEYDQEIPQSQTADNPVASRGRAAQPSRDTRKTN